MIEYKPVATETQGNVIITGVSNFGLEETFDCGQAFRWRPYDETSWIGIALGRTMRVGFQNESIVLYDTSLDEYEQKWREYLDIDCDYAKIISIISENDVLKTAAEENKGIRILKQDTWEALCSFIISQNNNIPRIKGIIERLCENFGEALPDGGFTFPSAEKIAALEPDDLSVIRCGFRARYIIDGARKYVNKDIDLNLRDLKPDFKVSLQQIKLGIPVSLQFTMTSIGSMCLQSVVNSFGKEIVAGFTAAARVENLTNLPMSALGVATQTFVGQNYGSGNYERIIKNVKKIFLLNIVVSVFMSITLYTIGEPMVKLFMDEINPEMLAGAKRYILAIAQCYSGVAVLFVMRNTLQGLGFTYSNSIAGVGEFFGRLSVAFILTPILGFDAVCYAGPAAWLLADIPLIIIYLIKQRQFKKMIAEKSEQIAV